jgi:hypothetical protein
MERTMSTNAKSKLRALAEQFRKNDEPELADIYAALARGERVLPRLDELGYWSIFGLTGSMFVAFIALQQEEDPAANDFAVFAQFMSLYHAHRLQGMAAQADQSFDPRTN